MKNIARAVMALLFVTIFAGDASALVDSRLKRYATAAELSAKNDKEGVIAYALDTDSFYVRHGTSWLQINSGATSMAAALTLTGDLTAGGGEGAITAVAAGSSLVVLNNSATGFVAGSSGNPNMLQFDTQTGAEKIVVEGTTTAVALHVDLGTLLVDESAAITGLATVGGTLGVTGVTTPIGGVAQSGGTTLLVARPGSVHTGGVPATATGEGFDATPVITEIYYSELFVPCNMTVTGISVFNGSAVTDDWHRALLDVDGDLVAGSATGAVTSAGIDVYQKVPFAGGPITLVGPATYFVAQIADGVVDRYNAHGEGTTELAFSQSMIAGKITGQVYGAIPATNSLTMTFTTDLGPIASLY